MKKFLFLLLLAASTVFSQTSATYVSSTENMANPERGFYKHSETFSSNFKPLSQSTMNTYRSQGITLVLRVYYMDSFLYNPILSNEYLQGLNQDFSTVRNAGLKMIVRFAYSNMNNAGSINPTKTIIISHIQGLKPTLDMNRDVILTFQAGFVGAWGEWYYTDHLGTGKLTAQNIADRKEIAMAILYNFPAERSISLRTPLIKQQITGTTVPLTQLQSYLNTPLARFGHHNDCFLASSSDYGTYTNITTDLAFLAEENKYLPMGGETCNVDTNYTNCANAIQKMSLLSFDYLNIDYNPDVINGWKSAGCMYDIQRKLGYRFEFINTTVSSTGVQIDLKNVGFGHLFNQRYAYLIYRNSSTGEEYQQMIQTDPRHWLKGQTITLIHAHPTWLPPGEYNLLLNLPDNMRFGANYAIQFANQNVWEDVTGYNKLNVKVTIGITPVNNTPLVVTITMVNNNRLAVTGITGKYKVSIYTLDGVFKRSGTSLFMLAPGEYVAKIVYQGVTYSQNFVKK